MPLFLQIGYKPMHWLYAFDVCEFFIRQLSVCAKQVRQFGGFFSIKYSYMYNAEIIEVLI